MNPRLWKSKRRKLESRNHIEENTISRRNATKSETLKGGYVLVDYNEYSPNGDENYCRYFNKSMKLHRTNGPAIESLDGKFKSWWIDGKLHRTDGPAVIDATQNRTEYWIKGKKWDKEKFLTHFDEK